MLPVLRTITVGGVFLALTIFLLALVPPDRARMNVAHVDAPARGPLIDRAAHPEWRQLLLLAAFRRAAELKELRELPDTPVRQPPPPPPTPTPTPKPTTESKAEVQFAALPIDGYPGSGAPDVSTTIPLGIGEASSTELPVLPQQEQTPVITLRDTGEEPSPSMSQPTLAEPMQPEKADKPPAVASTPHASDTPTQTATPQPQQEPVIQPSAQPEKPADPPAVSSLSTPRETKTPAQTSSPKQQHEAMRSEGPDKPSANTSKPQAARTEPQASRAISPARTRRTAQRHPRTAKPAKTAAQPAPFDLFGLLAASFLAKGGQGGAKSAAAKRN